MLKRSIRSPRWRKELLRRYDHVQVSTKFVYCDLLWDTNCTREQFTLLIVKENAFL